MFNIGFSELILILLVAFVVVGPKDLPRVARALGRAVRTVRAWLRDFKDETGIGEAIDEFHKTSRDLEKTLKQADPRPELNDVRAEAEQAIREADKAAREALNNQQEDL